jgi:hypothetical protein
MARKPAAKDFLSAAKAARTREAITIPGMDCALYARALSATEVRLIGDACLLPGKNPTDGDGYDDAAMTLAIIGASVVDEAGERVIPEGRESEIDELPHTTKAALQRAAFQANGMLAAIEGNG